jgi:hypothetical protein
MLWAGLCTAEIGKLHRGGNVQRHREAQVADRTRTLDLTLGRFSAMQHEHFLKWDRAISEME